MITLEPQLEQQIKNAATIEGLSSSELIKNLFFEYQQEVLKRTGLSHAEYKKTGKSVSLPLDPLDCSRPITYSGVENTDELAFTHIEDAAQYGKQLRSSAWNRSHKHD
ncbi:MAG: hypothetical protein GQ581_09290 [Methyloprofundus sp.]|nr:hypothetical protein [Methyloprofundus sp.]